MKRSVILLAMGIFLISTPTQASIKPQDLPKPITLEADYAIFRTDGGKKAYVEISYAIQCARRLYSPSGPDSVAADLLMRVKIANDDSLWAADLWRTTHRLATSDLAHTQRIVNVLRYPISTGAHVARLFVQDLHHSAASDSFALAIAHHDFSPEELALGDVVLASSITVEKVATHDLFHKNSLRVIPNPSAIFGAEQPAVFYYLEIYNLQKNVSGSSYRTRVYVADVNDAPVASVRLREQVKPMLASSVEAGSLNIGALSSGAYFLHFELLDAAGTLLKSAAKRLVVYNPTDVTQASADRFDARVFADVTDAGISREIEYTNYLYDEAEKQIAQKLVTPRAKREFLLQFWKRRGRQAGMPWPDLRDRYLQATRFANENFRSFAREGWRTDRGRVYLIYGQPDDIERFPSSDEAKPYEIWTYNGIEGGVEFIFGDRLGLREYQLLHSSKLGEIKNENWRALLVIQFFPR